MIREKSKKGKRIERARGEERALIPAGRGIEEGREEGMKKKGGLERQESTC